MRTRMSGGVGAGRAILPATRLGLLNFVNRVWAIPDELVCNAHLLNFNLDRRRLALEISLYLARNNLQFLQSNIFFDTYLCRAVNWTITSQVEAITPLD